MKGQPYYLHLLDAFLFKNSKCVHICYLHYLYGRMLSLALALVLKSAVMAT